MNIKTHRFGWIMALCAAGLFCVATTCHGKTIFYDDFSDGDIADGMPVTWDFYVDAGDTISASPEEGLFLDANRYHRGVRPHDVVLSDTSMRTRIRLVEGDSGMGVKIRCCTFPADQYRLTFSSGEVVLGYGTWGNTDILVETTSPLRIAEEDVTVQLDAIGEQLSAWVWGADESMPHEPLFEVTHSSLSQGAVVLFVNGGSSGYFRYVHVADSHIPEPSTFLLTLLTALLACARRWGI